MTKTSTYDDIVYGSGSGSDSDDETGIGKQKTKAPTSSVFIRDDSETPADLLNPSTVSRISSYPPRKPYKKVTRQHLFKPDQDGRMIIDERDQPPETKVDVEYDAYQELQQSNDMAKRGYRDRVKFSNKRSRQDAEDFDVEMVDAYEKPKKVVVKKKVVKF